MARTRKQEACENPDPPTTLETAATLVAMSEVELLTWSVGKLLETTHKASPHTVAYVTAVKDIRATHAEVRAALAADDEDTDPAELTPEEWRERIEEAAREAPDDDLELYVMEWLTRRGLTLETDGDAVALVRVA